MAAEGLLAVCRCPRCGGALADSDGGPRCAGCGTVFPVLSGIPCLFREPDRQVAEWRRQLGVYARLLQGGIDAMGEQGQAFDLLPATRRRLEALRAATALNGERLMAMMRMAGLTPADPGPGDPESQFSFIEYYDHILRDWGWDQ